VGEGQREKTKEKKKTAGRKRKTAKEPKGSANQAKVKREFYGEENTAKNRSGDGREMLWTQTMGEVKRGERDR